MTERKQRNGKKSKMRQNSRQNERTDYGNWVPASLMYAASAAAALLILTEALNLILWKKLFVGIIAAILLLSLIHI